MLVQLTSGQSWWCPEDCPASNSLQVPHHRILKYLSRDSRVRISSRVESRLLSCALKIKLTNLPFANSVRVSVRPLQMLDVSLDASRFADRIEYETWGCPYQVPSNLIHQQPQVCLIKTKQTPHETRFARRHRAKMCQRCECDENGLNWRM